jgi:hypothetical protein
MGSKSSKIPRAIKEEMIDFDKLLVDIDRLNKLLE